MKKYKYVILILFMWVFISFIINTSNAQQTGKEKPVEILYVDLNHDDVLDENDLLLVMSVKNYKKTFGVKTVPLERMLRAQIDHKEYIALNHQNFVQMDKNNDGAITISDGNSIYKINLAKVTGVIIGSYISTKAEKKDLGSFKVVVLHHLRKGEELLLKPQHAGHFHNGRMVIIKSKVDHPHVGL